MIQAFAIALSWGCWILATLWVLFQPNRVSWAAFIALMLTTKEFLAIARKEDYTIKTLLDPETGDTYIVKLTDFEMNPPTTLAWVCGQESDHFISYEGLDKKESYRALRALAETPPREREDK